MDFCLHLLHSAICLHQLLFETRIALLKHDDFFILLCLSALQLGELSILFLSIGYQCIRQKYQTIYHLIDLLEMWHAKPIVFSRRFIIFYK